MTNKLDSTKAKKRGLSLLDRLELPEDQRDLLNWLSRHPESSYEQFSQAFATKDFNFTQTLNELLFQGAINEAIIGGKVVYRVVVRSTTRKSSGYLPAEIWARVDMDSETFLKQVPIFRELNEAQIKEVSMMLKERRYQRDDVILWQGQTSDFVFFIKSGIVEISRFSGQPSQPTENAKVIAYLKQGDTLGEINAVNVSSTTTATATAKSTVDALLLKKADFLALLYRYPSVAVELTRLVAQRLATTVARSTTSRLCLIVEFPGVDAMLLGSTVALTLGKVTQRRTAYTEQPDPDRAIRRFKPKPDTHILNHEGGFDVYVSSSAAGLPPTLRATLALDQLSSKYEHIVMTVPAEHTEIIYTLIPNADQIILVATPEPDKWAEVEKFNAELRKEINPEKVTIFTAIVRQETAQKDLPAPAQVDFDLPFTLRPPAPAELRADNVPTEIGVMAKGLADRLGRTNQISVFIPTTIDVNTSADTKPYVDRTLAFLGERFGGATSSEARGVWNSAEAGLVGENIYIVRSYATQGDLNNYLQDILNYVDTLKQELRQEAMAVEINQKLLLI